jgi:hypothetical protein
LAGLAYAHDEIAENPLSEFAVAHLGMELDAPALSALMDEGGGDATLGFGYDRPPLAGF